MISMDQAVCGQAWVEDGCTGVCAGVHECVCVYICMTECQGGRLGDPGEMAAPCQADNTYPDSSACPPTQPGRTQSSRDKNRSPHC